MTRDAAPLFRILGLLWLTVALAGVDLDPWLLHPDTVTLPLPSQRPVFVTCLVTALFGVTAVVRPRAFAGARRLAVSVGSLAAFAALFLATPFARPTVHCIATVATLCATVLATALTLRAEGARTARTRTADLATAGLAIVVTLLVGEAVLALTPRSHAVGYTLAARLWFERYWHPDNALGYRDREHVDTAATKIFALGDSFTSGLGIADPADRLSDRLQARVGDRARVYNLGRNDSDTRDEYARLVAHPLRPDVVVLLYYVNDIEGAAEEAGHTIPTFRPYADVPDRVAGIIRRSYLLDFAYWLAPHGDLARFEGTLEGMYRDPTVLALHLADLGRIVGHCRSIGARLVVVAFPHLARPAETAALLHPIVGYLRDERVPVVEVAPLVAGEDPRRFYVNRNDAHPNERLSAILTDAVAAVVAPTLP